jgi:hypothetical protein
MKNLALAISLLGLFTLLIFLAFLPAKTINSKEDLLKLKDNEKVLLQGKVVEEKFFGKKRILTFDNGLEISCECPFSQEYLNKKISAIGIINNFSNKKTIIVLKIRTI